MQGGRKFWHIVPQVPTNPWSSFRDLFMTNARTDKGDIIEPVALLVQKRKITGLLAF